MTKYMRSLAQKPFLMIGLVSCLLFFTSSCQRGVSIVTPDLSGEEIFNGVFFFEGALTEMVPYLKESSDAIREIQEENTSFKENSNQLRQFRENLIGFLNKKDASFFTKFRKGMTSGDPYLVKQTVASTTKEINNYVESLQSKEELNNSKLVVEKALKSDELKRFMSKSNLTKEERKSFISTAYGQIQKESNIILKGAKKSSLMNPNSTNCLAFEIVFVGLYFFILAAVFVYISLLIAIDGLALATVLYEDFQFLDDGNLSLAIGDFPGLDGGRRAQTKNDVAINQLTTTLSLPQ